MLWNLSVTYLAISYFCFRVGGDQIVEQYSKLDLTRDLYAMLLVSSFLICRLRLKNPSNLCALDVMLLMCVYQVMFGEIVTPRHLAVSTDLSVCHFKM